MPVRPLRDNIVIVADERLPETGQIIVAAGKGIVTSEEQFGRRGRVVAVGPGAYTKHGGVTPVAVCIGDVVRYGEWIYRDITEADGRLVTVISEKDVIGIESSESQPVTLRYDIETDTTYIVEATR